MIIVTRNHAMAGTNAKQSGRTGTPLKLPQRLRVTALISFLVAVAGSPTLAQQETAADIAHATYEKVYVPAYSMVMTHDGTGQRLASTMVIHNTDADNDISVMRADYFDNTGAVQNTFVTDPIVLAPFESRSFLVPINDQSGGFGANFLVEWRSDTPVTSPAIEAIMIGGSGTQGISFVSSGRVIERTR